jgi:hypothetical protein
MVGAVAKSYVMIKRSKENLSRKNSNFALLYCNI